MSTQRKTSIRVLIVGGGFAGVRTALQLAKNPHNQITLISDREEFQYYPTLYSSATGHSHVESWAPLGEIFADYQNVHVYIDKINHIDAEAKVVRGESGTVYHYATLVMAVGVVTTYFGIPGLETFAYGIKSEAEIKKLKQRLFVDIGEKNALDRNYIVIGAGPTGTELSAALGVYLKRLCKHYGVKDHGIKIHLIEAAPRVLPRSSEQTSRVVEHRLRKLGVIVQTNKKVEEANAEALIVNGKPIASHTVIWTSGVTNNPLFAQFPSIFTLDKRGKVVVDAYMKAHKDIYVIGDNAAQPPHQRMRLNCKHSTSGA
jgi:NADH dehydrogenase FAD-containing subunit